MLLNRWIFDADFASDIENIKLIYDNLFTIYGNLVCREVKLQSIMALSTIETNFIVCTKVVKEYLWYRGFYTQLGFSKGDEVATMHCDNLEWASSRGPHKC